jgi:archaellum component FlaC
VSKKLPRPSRDESVLALQKLLRALDDAIGKLRVQVDGIDRDLVGIEKRLDNLETDARRQSIERSEALRP